MLNKEQQKVVEEKGSLVNIAGPGSGKTKTLISKIEYLIKKKNLNVKDLLVLTFTNSAANEIKERALKDINVKNQNMFFGTYHSIFKKLLTNSNIFSKIGLKENTTIIMPKEINRFFINIIKNDFIDNSKKLINIAIENHYLHTIKKKPNKITFTRKILNTELINGKGVIETFDSVINELNIKDIEKANDLLQLYSIIKQKALMEIDKEIDRTIAQYKRKLEKNKEKTEVKIADTIIKSKCLGFTAYKLLEQNKIKKEKIIEKLNNHLNVYIKHKIEQSIISFGDIMALSLYALVKIDNFRKEMQYIFKKIFVDEFQDTNTIQAEIIYLLKNKDNICVIGDPYQSIYGFLGARVKNILQAKEKYEAKTIQLIKNYRSNKNIVDLTNHLGEKMIEKVENWIPCESANKEVKNNKIKYLLSKEEEDQSKFIVNKIMELPMNEKIGIINRTGEVYFLENELKRMKFKYNKLGGESIGESIEVRVLIHLYIYVLDRTKTDSLLYILSNIKGIGDKSINDFEKIQIDKLKNKENNKKIPKKIEEELKKLKKIIVLNDFEEKMKKIKEYYFNSIYINISRLWNSDREEEAKQKLDILFDEIFELKEEREILSLLEEYINGSKRTEKNELTERITITTIHSSKGLEWNTVFYMNAGGEKFKRDKEEEAQRLIYVTVSRAKENLYILSENSHIYQINEDYLENNEIFENLNEKEEETNIVINFGKYKGVPIENVPYNYLNWMFDNKEDLLRKRMIDKKILLKLNEFFD